MSLLSNFCLSLIGIVTQNKLSELRKKKIKIIKRLKQTLENNLKPYLKKSPMRKHKISA